MNENNASGVITIACGAVLFIVAIIGMVVDSTASKICVPVLTCGILEIFYGADYLRRLNK